MVNPHDSLPSFQACVDQGTIELHPCKTDSDLQFHVDDAGGQARFTYVFIEAGVVVALASVLPVEPMGGSPCFQIGYAVPEQHRGKGGG